MTYKKEINLEDYVPAAPDVPKDDAELGEKFDTGKPEFRLFPPWAHLAIVRVLTFGAKKYAPDNWRYVVDRGERYEDAMLRHINAWQRGEMSDYETGEHPLAHAACCIIFILEESEETRWVQNDKPERCTGKTSSGELCAEQKDIHP